MLKRILVVACVMFITGAGCGTVKPSPQPSSSVVKTETLSPEQTFEAFLNSDYTAPTDPEKIPYSRLVPIAAFEYVFLANKTPTGSMRDVVFVDAVRPIVPGNEVYIARFNPADQDNDPGFAYFGPVQLSSENLRMFALENTTPRRLFDTVQLMSSRIFDTKALGESQKSIRDWLLSFEEYTSSTPPAASALKGFERVIGMTLGVPHSDSVWEEEIFTDKNWRDGKERDFYIRRAMPVFEVPDQDYRYEHAGPFRDNVLALVKQAAWLEEGEKLSVNVQLFSSVATASTTMPRTDRSLKNWLAAFTTEGARSETIDLKKFKPVFQIVYSIPQTDAIKTSVLYSEDGWKNSSEKMMYIATDESSLEDMDPKFVFYGPFSAPVAKLVAEAKGYKKGEIIHDHYQFSALTWYQK